MWQKVTRIRAMYYELLNVENSKDLEAIFFAAFAEAQADSQALLVPAGAQPTALV